VLTAGDAERLQDCLAGGGVALFPADTVYGLACDPEQPAAVARLYELKGRPPRQPAAVLFASLALAQQALPELHDAEREALAALLPGPVTLLLPNRAQRFPLACGPHADTLGLRVPDLAGELAPLRALSRPLLQSSANRSGAPDARRLQDVDAGLLAGVDLVLDGGERPGIPSTVVDLRAFERERRFEIVREGALSAAAVAQALRGGAGA
jgi:L-threonylcarbamoyladenylate synthase